MSRHLSFLSVCAIVSCNGVVSSPLPRIVEHPRSFFALVHARTHTHEREIFFILVSCEQRTHHAWPYALGESDQHEM